MATSVTLGVNTTESSNRIRFEKLSQRLQKIDVDIVHKAQRENLYLDNGTKLSSTQKFACYFQDELDQCSKLETSQHFRRYVLIYVLLLVILLDTQRKDNYKQATCNCDKGHI